MIIKIKKLKIGYSFKPKIIAEISCNHSGSKKKFLKMIEEAHKNGADLVKIQSYEPEDMVIDNKKTKIKKGLWKTLDLGKLYKKAQTPFPWHKEAFALAKKKNIILFSTPFSERAVDMLERLNAPLYKIASFEITDFNLIKKIAKTKKPIIMSTGMSNLKEIREALNIIQKYHSKIIILHCISGYPTLEKEANIEAINTLKKEFPKFLIGLSDHTNNINTSLAATMLRPAIIEKHFKLDGKKTYDSSFSINKKQLKKLSIDRDKLFSFLGHGEKKLTKTERTSVFFRRSIYAIKDIKKGEKFTNQNIKSYRPQTGLSAKYYFDIIGKKNKISLKKDKVIKKINIGNKI